MKRVKYSEPQIVKAFQEEGAGRKADDICRELGISCAIFYNCKRKFSGREVHQFKGL